MAKIFNIKIILNEISGHLLTLIAPYFQFNAAYFISGCLVCLFVLYFSIAFLPSRNSEFILFYFRHTVQTALSLRARILSGILLFLIPLNHVKTKGTLKKLPSPPRSSTFH